MDNKDLANLIFPDSKDISFYEEKYPKRELEEGAVVTRYAPSPTGVMHIGGLYQSLIAKKIAEQTGGVFFVRIEDTDQKREIENGVEEILNSLEDYGLEPDETVSKDGIDIGNYGPYMQSKRKEIYQAYAKYLISEGKAYPCFCSADELNEIREKQEKAKQRTGYYGSWTKCRNMPIDMAAEKIKNGEDYIIRLKSPGNPDKKIKHKDVIKGSIEFPENDQDIVIIKSDGLPTYHFAHAIDDHLMGTTLVIRGDEWIASVPLHLQLFYVLGFKAPKYAHIAPIMKEEDGNKRKLSKRKDPEAAVGFYKEEGIPKESVAEYLMNIANSNFEAWRKGNKDKDISEFKLELNKMGVSGALFDMVKLLDVSKGVISKFSADEVLNRVIEWSKEYDEELYELISRDKKYALKIFGIERGNIKPRKDVAKWSEVKNGIIYMFDDEFLGKEIDYEFQKINDLNEIKEIVMEYKDNYFDIKDDKDTWFNKMKDLSEKLGYAREVKEFKQNPENYKGHVGDISTVIRVALTGRSNTPDLYEIMNVLGEESIIKRFEKVISRG
ncbi:MAG: glutamate--tRNA ligase [Clostridia bacterium]|nr:glutamate--tRNA ligase [Clostridia bacterium]